VTLSGADAPSRPAEAGEVDSQGGSFMKKTYARVLGILAGIVSAVLAGGAGLSIR